MSSHDKLSGLRAVVANESLDLAQRKTAAEHYLAALTEGVAEPGDDHPEVEALRTPPPAGGSLGDLRGRAWAIKNVAYGWSESGPTMTQARMHVRKRLQLRALLAVIVDQSAHRLERLQACWHLREGHLHPRHFYRVNNYTAEQMLAKVLPETATKYAGWNLPPVPVQRPPMNLADVL